MSFQWIHMRIQEELDRRKREALTLERLPQALEQLYQVLREGLSAYRSTFGADAVESVLLPSRIKVTALEPRNGQWHSTGRVEVILAPDIPGFRIERGEYSVAIEIGLLPSNKLYYRDREQDVYLTMEELTKRILDRILFPKLKE